MKVRGVIAVGSVVVSGLVLGAQAPVVPGAPPQATFRAGVDVVTFDVIVLDKDRKPVRGLTAADFTVIEDGKARPIVAFTAVDVPGPALASAPWMREVSSDVVSNAIETRRLVMILMDDAYTSPYFGAPPVARALASRVVDELGPDDLAAVIFTKMGRSQNFTQDRTALRRAIASFTPKRSDEGGPPLQCIINREGCVVAQVALAAKVLLGAPAGRKSLIYIGAGAGLPSLKADDPLTLDVLPEVGDMFRDLQRANITVYAFDPDGLRVSPPGNPGLRWLAETTGGRAVMDTNAPEAHVGPVMAENAHYYLLGFQTVSAAGTRSDFRKVDVRVNRRDVDVRARSGYFPLVASKPSKKKPPAPINAAVAGALPKSDLALGLHVLPFAAPSGKDAEIAIVVRVTETANGESTVAPGQPWPQRTARVLAVAYDDGYSVKGSTNRAVSFRMQPHTGADAVDRYYEILSRLPIKPGRYELRVAVEVDGRVGSAYTMVDVPNFEKTPLSLSPIAISRTPAIATAPSDAMHGLVPIVPTAVREFARTDRVEAFVRLHQRQNRPASPVEVTSTITAEDNRPVFTETSHLAADTFTRAAQADYRLALPLMRLPPGQYLLTMHVTAAATSSLTQSLRFSVR